MKTVAATARSCSGFRAHDLPSSSSPTVAIPDAALQKFAGVYLDDREGLYRRVVFRDGKLWYLSAIATEMRAVGKDSFELVGLGARLKFETDGDVPLMTVMVNGQRVHYRRIDVVTPAVEDLDAYAGEYWSDELAMREVVSISEGALTIAGGAIRLAPRERDAFDGGGMPALRFQRDAKGAVTGFRLSTLRVRNVEFRRVRAIMTVPASRHSN